MLLDIEEIKNEIATALFNQCENTQWELGIPQYKLFSGHMAEQIILITKLASIYAEHKQLELDSKPQCERTGHCWELLNYQTLTNPPTDHYNCKHCKKHRVKVRKELLVWEE